MPKCERSDCGFEGGPEKFEPCLSPYHDFRCPKCMTTAVNTADVNGDGYGYGDHNSLNLSGGSWSADAARGMRSCRDKE